MNILLNNIFLYIMFVNIFLSILFYFTSSKQNYHSFIAFAKKILQNIRHNFCVFFVVFFLVNIMPFNLDVYISYILYIMFFIIGTINLFLFINFNSFLNFYFLENAFLTNYK